RFGLLERAAMHRDGARLIAPRRSEPAVKAPEGRQASRRDGVAEGVWSAAEGGGGVIGVVLEEPRFCECAPQGVLILPGQTGRPERRPKHFRGLGTAATLERGTGARQERLKRGGGHGGSIPGIQGRSVGQSVISELARRDHVSHGTSLAQLWAE